MSSCGLLKAGEVTLTNPPKRMDHRLPARTAPVRTNKRPHANAQQKTAKKDKQGHMCDPPLSRQEKPLC
ncbi:UNVERIFIED_CONTAM: hypothetical protein FKN15_071221 [Acipenser sinensis]